MRPSVCTYVKYNRQINSNVQQQLGWNWEIIDSKLQQVATTRAQSPPLPTEPVSDLNTALAQVAGALIHQKVASRPSNKGIYTRLYKGRCVVIRRFEVLLWCYGICRYLGTSIFSASQQHAFSVQTVGEFGWLQEASKLQMSSQTLKFLKPAGAMYCAPHRFSRLQG